MEDADGGRSGRLRPSGRVCSVVAVALLAAFGSLSGVSHAQIPPLPPETQPVTEVVSPIAAPACGNAILGATILAGTAPPEAREALELATANLFVVCGSIPIPPTAPTRCVDDDVLATVLAQVGGLAIGGALPVAPPSAGQVVDAIRILQQRFPVPADDEGLVVSLAAALDCRFAATTAPPGAVPTAPTDTGGTPPQIINGGLGLVPIGTGPSVPLGVLPPYAGDLPPAAAPVVPSGISAPAPGRPVSHPIWIVPLVAAVAAAVVGRGLLAARVSAER